MKYRPYPAYKDSGVEWLGKVPEHWGVLPFTKYVEEKSDYRGKTPEKVSDGVFLVTARNVRMGFIDYESSKEYVAEDEYDEIMRRGLPKKGDILFTTEAPLGNVALVDREDIALAQRIIRFRMNPKHFESRFTLYAMMSDHFQVQLLSLSTGSTAEGLKASKLPILRIVAPPLPEQQEITEVLDSKTATLDILLAKKRALIEKLNEKRTALISQTVTRGLPPNAARTAGLDPHPKLKPSGIEWLGDVPVHWATRRLRHISDGITVGVVVNPSSYVTEDGVPFLLGGDVREFSIDISNCNRCALETSNGALSKSQLAKEDLVVVRVGYPGVAAVVPPELDGANCASMMIVRRHPRFSSQWLAYVFNSQVGRDQIGIVQYGAAQKQFNISHAVDFSFPFPPLSEQRAIAEYLDCETAKIEQMVARVEAVIERLQEYRTALITAAVTGKIDVREVAV